MYYRLLWKSGTSIVGSGKAKTEDGKVVLTSHSLEKFMGKDVKHLLDFAEKINARVSCSVQENGPEQVLFGFGREEA